MSIINSFSDQLYKIDSEIIKKLEDKVKSWVMLIKFKNKKILKSVVFIYY